jgi:NifU-like protein
MESRVGAEVVACSSPRVRCGKGQAGALACGLRIRLHLELDAAREVVCGARLAACGSGPRREALAAVSRFLEGKALEQVQRLTHRDIADTLQDASDQTMVHAVLVHEALNAALADCRGEPSGDASSDPVVCRCSAVREGMIGRVVRMNALTSVVEITRYTSAGGGCGSCAAAVEEVLLRVREQIVS